MTYRKALRGLLDEPLEKAWSDEAAHAWWDASEAQETVSRRRGPTVDAAGDRLLKTTMR